MNDHTTYELYPTRSGFAVLRITGERAEVIDWFQDGIDAQDFVDLMNFISAPDERRLH